MAPSVKHVGYGMLKWSNEGYYYLEGGETGTGSLFSQQFTMYSIGLVCLSTCSGTCMYCAKQ